jgi:hypothetical protein
MSVDPRALAALAVVTRPTKKKSGNRPPRQVHVWSALRLNLPAIQQLYEAIGYDDSGGPSPHMDQIYRYDQAACRFGTDGWKQAFRRVFHRMGPLKKPAYDQITPAAAEMKQSGRITALGLAKSLLESGSSHYPPGARELIRGRGTGRRWRMPIRTDRPIRTRDQRWGAQTSPCGTSLAVLV